MSHRNILSLLAVAAVCLLAANASATEIIHFHQDFTDNSLADEVGSLHTIDADLGLQSQSAWRTPANSYFGTTQATTYETGDGFGNAMSFRATAANGGTQVAGRVFVYDTSYISDLATDVGSGFYSSGPIIVGEWDWATAGDFSFSSSALTGNRSDVQRSTLANAYTNGADFTGTADNTLASTLTDAALPGQLMNVQRNTVVFQANPAGGVNHTRLSTRAMNGSTVMGVDTFVDGGAGSYRSDYSGGLFLQMINHAGGNVTYASGVTGLTGGSAGGVDVPFNATENGSNLEFGLTSLTFKQVWQADSNADGVVNGAGDVPVWVGNFGGSGKSFFEGDSNGDGLVNGAGDVPLWVSQFGADVVGPGQIIGEYDPTTGEVLISMNNIGSLRIISDDNLLITANVPATIPGSVFHDPTTTNETNYGGFPLTTQDDFSMGLILPAGLALPNEQFVQANLGRILYTVFGGGPSQTNLPLLLLNTDYVPEPSSLIPAGIAGVGLVFVARRRRRVVA